MKSRNVLIAFLASLPTFLSCNNENESASFSLAEPSSDGSIEVKLESDSIINPGIRIKSMIVDYSEIDSLLRINLTKLYSKEVTDLIKDKSYFESAKDLIMSFDIVDSEIIFANNDKKEFQSFNIKSGDLTTLFEYPGELLVDYIDPVSDMFVSEGILYCATYNNFYKISIHNGQVLESSKSSFSKNRNERIREFNYDDIVGSDSYQQRYNSDLPSVNIDFGKNADTGNELVVFVQSGELKALNNNTTYNIDLDCELKNFQDIDIISISKESVQFVLKSNVTEVFNDVLVEFDFNTQKVLRTINLNSGISGVESQLGDPVCFPTGTKYKLLNGDFLWRVRTTGIGVFFENWRIDHDK